MKIENILRLALDFEAKVHKLVKSADDRTTIDIVKLQEEAGKKYEQARRLYTRLQKQ